MSSSVVTKRAFQGLVTNTFSKKTSDMYSVEITETKPANFNTTYKYCHGQFKYIVEKKAKFNRGEDTGERTPRGADDA